ncbi:hypothetical protein BJ170DRAFT_591269 [Xylariales sp. AK1849]|nr:hypothetical protein BJ170DRAFT_591269 [Xylariales sp. AK1849]
MLLQVSIDAWTRWSNRSVLTGLKCLHSLGGGILETLLTSWTPAEPDTHVGAQQTHPHETKQWEAAWGGRLLSRHILSFDSSHRGLQSEIASYRVYILHSATVAPKESDRRETSAWKRDCCTTMPPNFLVSAKEQCERLNEFPQFARLPPELRIKIWKMMLPPRLFLSFGLQGWYFGAKLLHVRGACKESRAVALSRGLICARDVDSSGHQHGWWNPSEDLLEWHHPSSALRTMHIIGNPPPLETIAQNCVVSVVMTRPYCPHFSWPVAKFIDDIVWSRRSWSQVRKIYIRPAYQQHSNYEPCTLHETFDDDIISQLLGDDWYTVIDLLDSVEIDRVVDILNKGELSPDVAQTLRYVQTDLSERKLDDTSERTWWESVKGVAERDWLRANFAVEDQPDIGYDAGDWQPFQNWDMKNPWIRDTLARMPQIRPAFILVKSDVPPMWMWSDDSEDMSDMSDYYGYHDHFYDDLIPDSLLGDSDLDEYEDEVEESDLDDDDDDDEGSETVDNEADHANGDDIGSELEDVNEDPAID